MYLEEREGFEPSVRSHARLISSQVHSTTLPPLLIGSFTALECSEGKEYNRVFCNGKPRYWAKEILILLDFLHPCSLSLPPL